MVVTADELKNTLDKYLTLAATEDILITRDGEVVAMLSGRNRSGADAAKPRFAVLPADLTPAEAREERIRML